MPADFSDKRGTSTALWVFGLLLSTMLAAVLLYSYRTDLRLADVFGNMTKKNEIISQMKTDLLRSVEAEKNAVLADTDEQSQGYANQARDGAAALERERGELAGLIALDRAGDEVKLLAEFNECWSEFQRVDEELLALAVQNTNLKAAALSFGKGSEAMGRFEQGMATLIERQAASAEGLQATKLGSTALAAGLGVYALEGPHIIASSNEQMDHIEAQMNNRVDQVKSTLAALDGLVKGDGRAPLSEAQAAFADFLRTHAEVLSLSRRNTNIKSMEISLGAKRKITAQCRETLSALQSAVGGRAFRATR